MSDIAWDPNYEREPMSNTVLKARKQNLDKPDT